MGRARRLRGPGLHPDCGAGKQHHWELVPRLEVLGPVEDPTRKTDRQRDTGEERRCQPRPVLLRHQTPSPGGRGPLPRPPLLSRAQAVGLELVMLAVCRWFRGGLWAGGRCHQLHEVLAPTGLRGTGHHSLLPTQQADLGRVGRQVGAQVGLARCGSPSRPPAPSPTHSPWWSGWGPASSQCPVHTSWR